MKLPNIPIIGKLTRGLVPDPLYDYLLATHFFLTELKKHFERKRGATMIITDQDLIDYGLINAAGQRLDDNGDPI